jgi:hypothetical protein
MEATRRIPRVQSLKLQQKSAVEFLLASLSVLSSTLPGSRVRDLTPEEYKRLCEQLEVLRFDFFELSGDMRDSSGKRETFFLTSSPISSPPPSKRRRLSSPAVSR